MAGEQVQVRKKQLRLREDIRKLDTIETDWGKGWIRDTGPHSI